MSLNWTVLFQYIEPKSSLKSWVSALWGSRNKDLIWIWYLSCLLNDYSIVLGEMNWKGASFSSQWHKSKLFINSRLQNIMYGNPGGLGGGKNMEWDKHAGIGSRKSMSSFFCTEFYLDWVFFLSTLKLQWVWNTITENNSGLHLFHIK